MTLPYRIILAVTTIMTIMRYFLLPGWTITDNILAFFFQLTTLIFLWWMLTTANKYFNKHLPYNSGIVKRLVIQITVTLILSSPVLFIVDYLSGVFFSHLEFMGPQFKALVVALFILTITFINFTFYAAYYVNQWKESIQEKASLQIRAAEADKERSIVQYQHLKNQVNPHFLFNTLTSLDGLILSDPALASAFVRHLAKVYRYVLEHTENEIINLESEIEFIKHYISVLNIRYGNALNINIDINDDALEKGVAMVTLQMLIDNAIKHNIVQASEPLLITIKTDAHFLTVTNNKQLRKQIESSTKKGIKHLQQLYKFLSEHPVEIHDTETHFQVKLPLL